MGMHKKKLYVAPPAGEAYCDRPAGGGDGRIQNSELKTQNSKSDRVNLLAFLRSGQWRCDLALQLHLGIATGFDLIG